ncbi:MULTISPECIES: NmrA family NAD(P)-binding protein [unclassified Pseudomonas]|uniref:NmrA family NAD(P)-binding protein n=1 Tax=unclassified Pseudomonas TaxID=196821 RepID=UPI00119A099B|nr:MULTISPECIES: NmrA family NAD(P)-binding protein [unclassified Pseudomonas]TWC22803.1 NmrA-like family protein [Pseudomonas sp. SJZ075]TWC24934.1 NmrA-like family protein [Pseudomonas sp. SJZ074]TWC38317.1 NmrA-like family protein [Pseudomonas sp. SJZ078]TWC40849.1 NmrA-like family protein [Pseudomonas sp. SJZ085]TWC58907.1 NmrA-like family protein [Pseudomonas sp. SJZ124]
MYTIMGVTGQVGAEVARALLAARQRVKVVVRDLEKGQAWAEKVAKSWWPMSMTSTR